MDRTDTAPRFLLTNAQRACMGLTPVDPSWEWVRLKSVCKDPDFENWACFDGDTIRKYVYYSPSHYEECTYEEQTAENRTLLLPRTARGKPKKLTNITLSNRKSLGMRLRWSQRIAAVELRHEDTARTYYSSGLEDYAIRTLDDLAAWLDRWAAETTPEDLTALDRFLTAKRRRVQVREGDFFRFSIGRRAYGYGRVLLDYYRMKKEGRPCWDILMCRPLVVKTYRFITDDPAVPVEVLRELPALPSYYMSDDGIFLGEYPVVGNLPLEIGELDFPIMYGGSISGLDRGRDRTLLQCGTLYRVLEDVAPLPGWVSCFRHNGVTLAPICINRPTLEACIAAGSNGPYWERTKDWALKDLRSPYCREQLAAVCEQMGLSMAELPVKLD
ncbi:MAG: hypothetical protein HFF60_03045 [Oscillospiraceae bacterium]|jgi:hypothetical protein|nr:hypothetical protein [Oscillospiraceae bacterium]